MKFRVKFYDGQSDPFWGEMMVEAECAELAEEKGIAEMRRMLEAGETEFDLATGKFNALPATPEEISKWESQLHTLAP